MFRLLGYLEAPPTYILTHMGCYGEKKAAHWRPFQQTVLPVEYRCQSSENTFYNFHCAYLFKGRDGLKILSA